MNIARQIKPVEPGKTVEALASIAPLPALIRKAADQLASATTAAEILDAREAASVVYDAAKKAARMAKAKDAHDTLIAAAHRAQADALEIEAMAKRRLADEYDAAQERGEIRGRGGDQTSTAEVCLPGPADIGLTHKDIYEARQFRDAEVNEPGIARRALDARLAQGLEPNKAALREAVIEAAKQGLRGGGGSPASSNKNPLYVPPTEAEKAWSNVYGTCRAFAEWATPENLQLAVRGRHDRRDDQSRNIAAVQRAIGALTDFERMLDAE